MFVYLLSKVVSSRTGAHTGVAIPKGFRNAGGDCRVAALLAMTVVGSGGLALDSSGESPQTMRARCAGNRYFPNPLGIVTATGNRHLNQLLSCSRKDIVGADAHIGPIGCL